MQTTVTDLFEAQVRRTPHATAAVAGQRWLTYAGLDARANRLARHLQHLGVGPEVLVGVCLGRSVDLAVALLAVLKAGGACVPLDPAYPPQHLAGLIADAAPVAVVTDAATTGRLSGCGRPLVRVDADAEAWAAYPHTAPARSTGAASLAYVIYTSGSTGTAKGVMLTHGALVTHHRAAVDLYTLGPTDRVVQFCSISFDASIEELFPTWAAGGAVVFRPDDLPVLGREWLGWLAAQRITVLDLPTAYWHAWTHDLDTLAQAPPEHLRLVIVGGEKALGAVYRTWTQLTGGRCRWINTYGPTEATCVCTAYQPPPGPAGPGDERDPPIGRPLPATTVRIVDRRGDPVEAGATGELLVAGPQLARGYLNAATLTTERFVAVATTHGPPARFYRTGDLVRQLPSGDLDWVGRLDEQVKIRGFRVERSDVEGALARHPAVAAAAVIAPPSVSHDTQLVAYVVTRGGEETDPGELRRFLTDRLPGYMVPSRFVTLDALPLTTSGKVDRAALPAPHDPPRAAEAGVRRSPGEEHIAAVWARVLGCDPADIGPDDDFFDLGGHSLLAAQVVAQLRDEIGSDTPLRAIFQAPTLRGFAKIVDTQRPTTGSLPPLTAQVRQPGARLPLSLAQDQMLSLALTADPPGLYNITAIHRFHQPVDVGALRDALAYLVARHEALRTRLTVDTDPPYQSVAATADVDVRICDLAAVPPQGLEEELRRRITAEQIEAFDPAHPPLLRAHLFQLDERAARLSVTFDHVMTDGAGVAIFMRELHAAYAAMLGGRSPDLAPLDVQPGDVALWQAAHVTQDVLRRQLTWWASVLQGLPVGPAVPLDHTPDTPTRRIASRQVTVGAATRTRLERLARDTDSSLFIVCTAATQALFARYGPNTDIVFSTTLNGRNRRALEGVIGHFAGIGRIRAQLSDDPPFLEIVRRARAFLFDLFDNQDVPFMRVRRELLAPLPPPGPQRAAALPTDFQFFHQRGPHCELFVRGQLHPLTVTLTDTGAQLTADFSYKLDFYHHNTIAGLADSFAPLLAAAAADPTLRLSQLPVSTRNNG